MENIKETILEIIEKNAIDYSEIEIKSIHKTSSITITMSDIKRNTYENIEIIIYALNIKRYEYDNQHNTMKIIIDDCLNHDYPITVDDGGFEYDGDDVFKNAYCAYCDAPLLVSYGIKSVEVDR